MKKLSIIMGMILFAAVALFSCRDESGEFVEQLYTNAQKELAIKDCLRASADSALNHLCVADGFYNYNNAVYRIDYSSLQSSLFDTLNRHGYGGLVDSLILHTNRLAENCKAQLAPLFTTAIDSLEIIDYDALIHGNRNAITKYFEIYKYQYLKPAFQTPVSIRMSLFGVTPVWNEMNQLYSQYANSPLNFDIQGYVAGKMLDGLLEEMSVEEALIRTDTTHQSESMELFGN